MNGSGFFAASGVFGGDVHAPSAEASGALSVGSQQPQYAGRGVAVVSDTDSVGFPAYLGAGRFAANETSSRDRRQSFASRVARVSRLERASKMIDYFESFIHSFIRRRGRTGSLSRFARFRRSFTSWMTCTSAAVATHAVTIGGNIRRARFAATTTTTTTRRGVTSRREASAMNEMSINNRLFFILDRGYAFVRARTRGGGGGDELVGARHIRDAG